MKWEVRIIQTAKYTEELVGNFEDIADALQFANLALENFDKVTVMITYTATNIVEEKVESEQK